MAIQSYSEDRLYQPGLQLPESSNTVQVRMFDTTTNMVVSAEYFVEPVRPGHEAFNLPTVGFLIENERLDKRIIYDLGCRKDFWNSPPASRDRMTKILMGLKVEKDATEVLDEAGVDLGSIDSLIWSHAHWDHIGNPALLSPSTELVVGPGFTSAFLPAYPANSSSRLDSSYFAGRPLRELSINPAVLSVGSFPAHDFFGDGSFYLLHAPGHCVGHLCGLARTTPTTFLFLGGDICHFPGYFRPSEAAPLPDPIPAYAALDPEHFPSPCPASVFEGVGVHPAAGSADAGPDDHTPPPHWRSQPFYTVTHSPHSAYVDRVQAVADIRRMQAFDACPDVLVCLAHDPTLLEVLPALNRPQVASKYDEEGEEGKKVKGKGCFLNHWKDKGWKERCHWRWLNEMPRKGRRGREALVEGLWRDGRVVETLERDAAEC